MGTDDDERYIKSLITHVGDLAQKLGELRAEVREDTAQLLAGYRQDVHRTTMAIHARLLSYEDELLRDRGMREKRQAEVDNQLAAIRNSQVWRIRIEVGLIVLALLLLAWWY